MKLYEITVAASVRYAGSQSAATSARNELLVKYGVSKKNAGEAIQLIEVPTGKEGLIAFLNQLASSKEA